MRKQLPLLRLLKRNVPVVLKWTLILKDNEPTPSIQVWGEERFIQLFISRFLLVYRNVNLHAISCRAEYLQECKRTGLKPIRKDVFNTEYIWEEYKAIRALLVSKSEPFYHPEGTDMVYKEYKAKLTAVESYVLQNCKLAFKRSTLRTNLLGAKAPLTKFKNNTIIL